MPGIWFIETEKFMQSQSNNYENCTEMANSASVFSKLQVISTSMNIESQFHKIMDAKHHYHHHHHNHRHFPHHYQSPSSTSKS